MTKLSDTQLVILTAASQRPDRLVLPLPAHLKGGAADKVIASLTAKGLVEEVDAQRGEPIWRETGDGHGVTLVATDAAFEALGIVAETGADGAPEEGAATDMAGQPEPPPSGAQGAPEAEPVRKTRSGTKQEALITLLRRPEGATADQIAEATGWQKHTIRGAIAGALRKKLGLTITTERVRMVGPNREGATGSYTIYRIVPAVSA